jgi:acetyltransferase-like isoleucine patch superfamily enzyme
MIEFLWIKLLRLRARLYTLALSSAFYSFGKRSAIVPPLRFNNLKDVRIGQGVVINGNCWIQAVSDGDAADGPKIDIRDGTSIGMDATITAAKKIVIEENVVFARNVHVSDHGHEYEDVSIPIVDQGIRKKTEVRIGAGSWIGQNAVILPGAVIGKNCVVGANSVVNGPIPDFCAAAGAPARIIKRFDQATRRWEAVESE